MRGMLVIFCVRGVCIHLQLTKRGQNVGALPNSPLLLVDRDCSSASSIKPAWLSELQLGSYGPESRI